MGADIHLALELAALIETWRQETQILSKASIANNEMPCVSFYLFLTLRRASRGSDTRTNARIQSDTHSENQDTNNTGKRARNSTECGWADGA